MNKSSTTTRADKHNHGGSSPIDSNKSLKMKIKRKNPANMGMKTESSSKHEVVKPGIFSGSGSAGNNSAGSSSANNNGGSSSSSAADRHDSNSNSSSSSSSVASSSLSSAGKITQQYPFEHLRQAILEQEKNKQQKLHHKSAANDKDKAKDQGAAHTNTPGFGAVFARGAIGHSTERPGHKPAKSDPYEFNAKNEDRLTAGLPSAKKLKTEKERVEMKDAMTDTSHIAIMTDPDCLGPCEPGTSVVLEGIVWQETENGLLVVNVTWRGKTYVGTLLDATKHEWAPPTFRSDSPQDPDARTPRTRGKRGRTTMNSMGVRGTRNTRNSSSSNQSSNPPPSPAKSNSAALGEKRKQEILTDITTASPAKKLKIEEDTPRPPNVIEDTWYVCFHAECNKRYRNVSALKYHQNHAHKDMLLTREQSSEHNKTHVRFSSQQTTAAQTDEKPKEKKNKKKKSKKNRTDTMEMDQTCVNSDQPNMNPKQPEAHIAVNSTTPVLPAKSSPDSNMALKQAFIQLTPLAVQCGATKAKTVTAPIVPVPLASQAQTQSANALSKEEKKREKKKRKKEKKEKKLLEQQQQLQKENGQRLAFTAASASQQNNTGAVKTQSAATIPHANLNRNLENSSKAVSGVMPISQGNTTQRQPLASGDRNKLNDQGQQVPGKDKEIGSQEANVHSPAYSDISDEGNDNVPVLENQVELAKKQTQNVQTAGPKESGSEGVTKSGQEPPNLTPVITHTGLSKSAPPGPLQSQIYPGSKDPAQANHVNNSGIRNVTPSSTNSELNRPREAFNNRESTKLSPNEMQQKRTNLTVQPPHSVYANFPPGYNLKHSPSNSKTAPLNVPPSQDRMLQQKLKEEGRSILPLGVAPSKGPPKLGLQQRPENRQADLMRRNVDSNMNMQAKIPQSLPNGPPIPHVNKPNPSPVTEINKQVPTLSNSEAVKANIGEHKRLPDNLSISERQSENEKILKENIELKTQMNDKDKEKSHAMCEQRYAAYVHQQQQRMAMSVQQQHYQRSRLLEQVSKPKPPGSSPESNPDSRPSPSQLQAPPASQPTSHPSVASLPRRDTSPMPSPKTKAELKQGGERKEGAKAETRTSGEHKRPESVDKTPEAMRASAMKSPGPSPSLSSPVPPPGAVPPGHYPYPYPIMPYGIPPYMFPPHSYMSYQDGKALEMLHQQASMYNREQNKAQDLRKVPDRKSPSGDVERPGSRSGHPEKRESPAPMTRSPQIPHPMAGHPAVSLPQWYMQNGPVPMMQQSPQQSSKH